MDECFSVAGRGCDQWPRLVHQGDKHTNTRYAKQQIEATRTSCILNRCTRQI